MLSVSRGHYKSLTNVLKYKLTLDADNDNKWIIQLHILLKQQTPISLGQGHYHYSTAARPDTGGRLAML